MPLDLPSLQSLIWNRSDYGITWDYYVLLYYRANTRPNLATGKKQLEPLHHPKKECSLLIMFQGLSLFSFFSDAVQQRSHFRTNKRPWQGWKKLLWMWKGYFFLSVGRVMLDTLVQISFGILFVDLKFDF